MKELNVVLTELGISKVRLAKYLGVSRQMLYNYLAIENLNDWPKEKAAKLLSLLNIENIEKLKDLKINGEYIIEVENRLKEGVKDSSNKEVIADLKGFNKLDKVIKSKLILYTISKAYGTTAGIEKIHIEDIIKLCNNNIGNKFLVPKKGIKIYVKKGKIFFIV